jgi:hypothetical protein
VIDVPLAHVGGIPIEETIGSFGPAFLVGIGVAWARLRAGLGPRVRSSERAETTEVPMPPQHPAQDEQRQPP